MSKTLLVGLSAALLLPAVASAQTPPAPSASSPSTNVDRGPPPPPRDGMGPRGHGAFIKLRGPGGAEIMVRCADGETTRDCADVASQLLEKAKASTSERSMSGGGWHDEGDRGGRWDREGRGRY